MLMGVLEESTANLLKQLTFNKSNTSDKFKLFKNGAIYDIQPHKMSPQSSASQTKTNVRVYSV